MSTIQAVDPAAELLFGKGRRELLALLFARPEQRFYLRELARLTGASAGTAQRELRALEEVGLIRSERRGRQLFFEANRSSPLFGALRTLLEQTMGAPDLLRAALAPMADRIRFACVYGSLAYGTLGPQSDVDVFVVGDVEFSEVTDVLAAVEKRLNRAVNPTVYTPEEFRRRREQGRHFLATMFDRPLIPLIGEIPPDARSVAAKRMAASHSSGSRGGSQAPRRRGPKPR
jgi:predicted nucleotidyltransferase